MSLSTEGSGSANGGLVLHTTHLDLIAATPALAQADIDGPSAIAKALGVAVPEVWPAELIEPHDLERTLRIAELPGTLGWNTWFVVERATNSLIGLIGFGGPPGDDGSVMIGYTIVPSARRRGYATEATRALVTFAQSDPRVRHVYAETYPTLVASIGVLKKAGFRQVEGGSQPDVIRFAAGRVMRDA